MISSLDLCLVHYRSVANCRGAVGYKDGKPRVFLHTLSSAVCLALRPKSVAEAIDYGSLYEGMRWYELFPVSKRWPPAVREQIRRLEEMTKKSLLQSKHPLDRPQASVNAQGEIEVSREVHGAWIPEVAMRLPEKQLHLARSMMEIVNANS